MDRKPLVDGAEDMGGALVLGGKVEAVCVRGEAAWPMTDVPRGMLEGGGGGSPGEGGVHGTLFINARSFR